MATPSAACTVKDGAAAAANVGALNRGTPGNSFTIALQSSTGVRSWTLRLLAGDFPSTLPPFTVTQTSGFSYTLTLPSDQGQLLFSSEVEDGNNCYFAPDFAVTLGAGLQASVAVHRARGVCTTAETLATFDSVSGGTPRDGVTYVQGDYVLLVNQATKSQNGLWVVGAVASGSAPLTRPPDWASAAVLPAGATVEVSEGTLFANTSWKVTTAGAVTVDTTNIDLYPRQVTQSITLSAGTFTVNNVPILSTSKTQVSLVRTATGGTVTSTIQYCPTSAGANGLTAGIVGTGQAIIQATVAAGTIANTDTSILACTITNW